MSEDENLKDVLIDLRSLIRKQTSFKYAFARGVLYGLGTVIGATVLIGVLTWVLGLAVGDISETPVIGSALEEAASQ